MPLENTPDQPILLRATAFSLSFVLLSLLPVCSLPFCGQIGQAGIEEHQTSVTDQQREARSYNQQRTIRLSIFSHYSQQKTDFQSSDIIISREQSDLQSSAIIINREQTDFQSTAIIINREQSDFKCSAIIVSRKQTFNLQLL